MKTYVLIYEGFAQFEVVLANYFLKTKGEIITVGIDNQSITSGEGFITTPHTTIDKVAVSDVDLFIIPGGDPSILLDNTQLYALLKDLSDQGKKMAAICSGVVHLAQSGVLKDLNYTTTVPVEEYKSFDQSRFVNSNIVVDQNIVTAKANGYVDFALELGRIMDIYENEDDFIETENYFKKFRD